MCPGTGRRKESVARVWIRPGTGNIWINHRPHNTYFSSYFHRAQIIHPLQVTDTLGLMDVWATTKGGGLSGQAGAVRLGVSRALAHWDPIRYHKILKIGLSNAEMGIHVFILTRFFCPWLIVSLFVSLVFFFLPQRVC